MSARLEAQFATFHAANPHVYELYVRFTREAKNRGYRKFSIAAITERVRWETNIVTTDKEFKLSNNHRAYYARLLNATDEFKDFFTVRSQREGK